MEFSIKNPKNTMGLLTWCEVQKEFPNERYELITGWKHDQSIKPMYLTPTSSPDTVSCDIRLLKAAEKVFKALDQSLVFLAVPGKELPILVMEEKSEDDMQDTDLVVAIAPKVMSDE